ncbi:CYTH domain-containing protein [Conexibacter woesei]|uniref:Adenylate cyclase n=1 Tax=Conexibacter woesei (strain DSM 14684 / CCUG 47730 / CIP 108061 / JCM 11494 / NBRC 100937 / ID131577) TaxID=469383 RepID=D3F149_CONWI|nr:CYTH domain-containing protein [Conexibacter woesei]ADB50125.1 adenylate cyclase [Conexibacter woesei DSM 14684]
MSTEIERKFVLDAPPQDLAEHPSEPIAQGYVALDEDVEVRVRRRGERTFLTIKAGSGRRRVEQELEIEPERFDALWPLTEGRRIVKRRYLVPVGADALTLEVDVYEDALAGLVVAECEFPDDAAADAFVSPDWLGREVTDDPRWKNQALALHGRPE